jgi:hypothetical protein
MRIRARLTYANVMSSIAVFLVLGGSAYAATQLPKNSVGSKQIKSNAVTSSKVRNGSLLSKDFKPGQLKAGPAGPKGDAGAPGAPGAPGTNGRDFSASTTLAPGATETGQWAAYGYGSAAGVYIGSAQSFRLPLASTPAANSAHYVASPAGYSAACPGPGQAASGQLCVYQVSVSNATPGTGGFPPIYGDEGTSSSSGRAARDGFQLYFSTTAAGGANAHGTYAVTG